MRIQTSHEVFMMYALQENYMYIKWQNILHDLYFNIKLNSGISGK